MLRLLNRQNLSGTGHPGARGGAVAQTPSGVCGVYTQPAVWSDAGQTWIAIAGSCGFAAYTLTTRHGAPYLTLQWHSSSLNATSPVFADGVVYAARSGAVMALDAHTGRQLWSSAQASAGGSIGGIHWQSPIVIGGRLYISDQNGNVSAYALG